MRAPVLELAHRQDTGPARGVHHVVGVEGARLAVAYRPDRHRPVVMEIYPLDHGALHDLDALAGGVLQQDLVEVGAVDLPGADVLAEHLPPVDGPVLLGAPAQQDAVLDHVLAGRDLLADAGEVDDRPAGRGDGLADVVAREVLPLEQPDRETGPGQQRGGDGAGRSAADDDYLASHGQPF